MASQRRIIVGMSGASGAAIGVNLLKAMRSLDGVESHLIVSASGMLTATQELGIKRSELEALADVVHNVRDIGAAVASGSFVTEGMVVAPCSMKTLASVANGFSDNLLTRAADVVLKERRRLVLVARETPLNLAHLRNMLHATEMGAIVMPPVPAFYSHPTSIEDVVNHTVGRILDLFQIEHGTLVGRWSGLAHDFAR
ncbi:UbiX family flavin prenyltransferase [Cupriavidus sp. UME77]|uniref:UbiX family flavin prenyltransferase n=1 Tax=Cupriavidus sp. UME77 TaxID=1862321 RepID=UPI001602FECB|nr:UbiX family flavin prenyltransferase [Cupriavidus sp. UME77]MBB1629938.1 3-octaprenyl-4-hydroxybenzoate carboxy-lyase [Cupriavidus sp. UME77]